MKSDLDYMWQVLEDAGLDTERVVAAFPSLNLAWHHVKSRYSSHEREELKVNITRYGCTEY